MYLNIFYIVFSLTVNKRVLHQLSSTSFHSSVRNCETIQASLFKLNATSLQIISGETCKTVKAELKGL